MQRDGRREHRPRVRAEDSVDRPHRIEPERPRMAAPFPSRPGTETGVEASQGRMRRPHVSQPQLDVRLVGQRVPTRVAQHLERHQQRDRDNHGEYYSEHARNGRTRNAGPRDDPRTRVIGRSASGSGRWTAGAFRLVSVCHGRQQSNGGLVATPLRGASPLCLHPCRAPRAWRGLLGRTARWHWCHAAPTSRC